MSPSPPSHREQHQGWAAWVVLPEGGPHAAVRARGAAMWRWVSAALGTISFMDLGCLLGWVELPWMSLPTGSLAFSCCPQPWALQCRRIVALSFLVCRFLGSPWSLHAATHDSGQSPGVSGQDSA